MARTLADRLGQARARSFVGRRAELDQFAALLDTPDEPAVVVVHGPAGIGKSTLLRQIEASAAEKGADCLRIDARDLPPTTEALGFRLAPVLDTDLERRTVVLIDAYELLADLDTAFREQLAPRLPHDVILVLAGQHPPSVGWRSDEGWSPVLHTVRLRNLSVDDCSRYLDSRGIPSDLQASAIAFTHGHPLALALVGEVVRQKGTLAPSDSADVVRVLLDRLLDAVPTPLHRTALEAAAQVRMINEPLLAALLEQPDVSELFDWMRALPFVDAGLNGLHLHDLAREVLAADLRWRHVERYQQFHDRAREHYLARLKADPSVQAAALMDLIYLHPELRAFLQPPDESATLHLEAIGPTDVDAVEQMVTRHEGAESGAIARHWLATRPETWLVVRGSEGAAHGALCLLPVETVLGADDPAVLASAAELAHHPPLRPGETATLIRYWLARDTYQGVSPAQSLIATQLARHFLTTSGLAVTLIPFAEPEAWAAFCAYADQRRAPTADFSVGGRTYASFEHDWRVVSPAAWVARLSQQALGAAPTPPEPAGSTRTLVLDQPDFTAAVRQALRDYPRPEQLRHSPLLRCRLVTTRLTGSEGPGEQAVLLKSLIKDAVETLATVPADRRLHRVLVRAYLAPAPTLERAAEVLELPSSTFRRLLTTAVARVTTVLWHQELDA